MQLDTSPFTLAAATPLGVVDAGPIGSVDTDGRCRVRGVDATVSCWIGADDRWHVPEDEASTRQGWMPPAQIVTTVAAIPGGSTTTATYGAVLESGQLAVCVDLVNESAIPVAVAYVVESSRPLTLGTGAIAVDGTPFVRLTRDALGFAAAPTAKELLAQLDAGDLASQATDVATDGAAFVAVVVPLPHTAHSLAALCAPPTPGSTVADEGGADAPLRRESFPTADQVASGWASHLSGVPTLESGDPRLDELFQFAVGQVVSGPPVGSSADELAAYLAANARLGRLRGSDSLIADVLDFQRTNGRIDDGAGLDATVRATIRFCHAAGALWAGGLAPDVADDLVGPVASAAHWLTRRRRRAAVVPYVGALVAAMRGLVPMLDACGQDGVSEDLSAAAASFATDVPDAPADRLSVLGASAVGVVPSVSADGGSAGFAELLELVLDAFVGLDGAAVDLFPSLPVASLRPQAEVHGVPTPAGKLSVAVRWHDARPALLWECAGWERQGAVAPLSISATSIDPSWSTDLSAGETLLEAPETAS